jgi:hypothetical protein
LYIASPLRAFDNELGGQAPVGYWVLMGFAADGRTKLGSAPCLQRRLRDPAGQSPDTAVSKGDFGFKMLTSSNPAEKTKKLTAEIASGRRAIRAIIGLFFQDGLTGSAWVDQALYTALPLRAFENELGMQAPGGLWDPAASPRIAAPRTLRTGARRRSSTAALPC